MVREDPWEVSFALARRGLGRTAPNPPVGAVIVQGGSIVGRGYHERAGSAHAEVAALRDAGAQAQNGDLYVTLEPCPHQGRTPPCVDAILASGIRRVFYGTLDPNPRVQGEGIRRLTAAGVTCTPAPKPWSEACAQLIRFYARHVVTGLPYVVYKYAMSLDGCVAAGRGEPIHLTGETADREVHRLRDETDAILVGIGTILADDPRLTTRLPGGRDPVRVVVDAELRMPATAQALHTGSAAPTLIACRMPAPEAQARDLRHAGAELIEFPAAPGGIDIKALLEALGQRGITSILLEGGPRLAGSFLAAGLVQELQAYIAPKLIGQAEGAGAVRGAPGHWLPAVGEVKAAAVGLDFRITALLTGHATR